jgi:hypothetical protein
LSRGITAVCNNNNKNEKSRHRLVLDVLMCFMVDQKEEKYSQKKGPSIKGPSFFIRDLIILSLLDQRWL